MKKLKLMTILGTRPEIIKMSAIIKKCDKYFDHVLVHTGQNYDYTLNEVFFKELGLREPDYYLGVVGENLGQTMGNVISKSYEIMNEVKPDAIIVLGDTNSCLSVISAKRLKIPVFHMEAGNRCKDENLPEEVIRRIVDVTSDVNLCYSEHARRYILDSGVNPYQSLASFSAPITIDLANATKEDYKSAIEGLKEINNTTLLQVNNVVLVDILKQTYANVDTSNIVGALLNEIFNVSLDNGNHRVVSDILHDDINTLLDIAIQEIDAGIFDALKDFKNYNVVDTLLNVEIEAIKQLLDLRYLTELKGQSVLEIGLSILGVNNRLDFATLTYENETAVIGDILDIIPNIIAETGCKSYADVLEYVQDLTNELASGQFNITSVVTKKNVENIIDILVTLENSEIIKQAAVPLYQAIFHPIFEATNNAGLIEFTHIDENIYSNSAFMADYTGLVDMLIALNEFGIYDIIFNDGIIDWSNGEVVEKVLNATLGSNIYKYKEPQLMKSLVHSFSKLDQNMSLIDADVIRLSNDISKISDAYNALIPVLTNNSFPLNRLSDLTK